MAKSTKVTKDPANEFSRELINSIKEIATEKGIDEEVLFQAVENSLLAACKNEYGNVDNIRIMLNRETGEFGVYADMKIVEEIEDAACEMTVEQAMANFPKNKFQVGDVVSLEVTPRNFGRIAAGKAKQVIIQKIREEERKSLYEDLVKYEKEVVTGTVQGYQGKNVTINIGKTDVILNENEQMEGEVFYQNQPIKLYVMKVEDSTKGPRITVSRSHPELVKRLFESEIAEIADGTVEIKGISREAGSRTKIAVYSHDQNVDPVGACVGVNGQRVATIVSELGGEKIDIVSWNESPEIFIQNALSPATVVSVDVDTDEKIARIVVPDFQLSLAIGKSGQNARLAAKLTGFKIDIKAESQVSGSSESEIHEY